MDTSSSNLPEVHIVWLTAGLSCDGDTISVTAAEQPSIEDILLGAIPGLPKVHLHNPVLAPEVSDDFMQHFYLAEQGQYDPFVFVVEGSIPNEKIKSEGYWAAQGTDPETGQPITTCEWIDRLAPKAWAIVAVGTCATYGGIHAMQNNPTGCMGLADYLDWNWRSKAGIPIVNVPGLTRVVHSMRASAVGAGVQLVTGDTKVVERGKGDKIFITTTGSE